MPPRTKHIHQVQGDTIPIAWPFSEDVDDVDFELTHSFYGVFTLTGVDSTVEFPITEVRAAAATTDPASPHTYTLVRNPGVEGSEETVWRGRWFIDAREAT